MMEREAEAERKRKEAASPTDKAPEQPSDKVTGFFMCLLCACVRASTSFALSYCKTSQFS